MPAQVLRYIRRRASQMAYNSVLYNWSLRGGAPERLAFRPLDPWPGDAEAGKHLCEGALLFDGASLPIAEHGWEPEGISPAWLAHIHGFSWLRDLRALNSERGMTAVAATHAKIMIRSWNDYYMRWDPQTWRMDILGQRLAMWLSCYEFFSAVEFMGEGEEEDFQDQFFDSVMRQGRHLSRCFSTDAREGCMGPGRFVAAKGLLYAGIAFEGCEGWAEQALKVIEAEIDEQIAGDGAHKSRGPKALLQILQVLLDVRMVLQAAAYPLPETIQHAIDRMGPALRFFRMNDKHLALFNGTQEGDEEVLDSVLRQAAPRGKTLSSLPCIGFERVTLGRTSLIMDCGAAPAWPYDAKAHAAPLAFEMNYGRERLFVNCGSHPVDPLWQDALRASAAHTALSLDARNACEIKPSGHFARKAQKVKAIREDLKNAVLLEASHDGYVPLNGFTHKRRLYLSDQGQDIRGEDVLSAAAEPSKPVDVAVRFHLHPKVMVSLIRDGEEALLRMPGGVGWRFQHMGGYMALEDSVYMGEGCAPRKTKQLVIYGQITDKKAQIKWALKKEG